MPSRKLPPDDIVVKMYESGLSCPQVAKACGVQSAAVHKCLVRIGYQVRSLSETLKIRRASGEYNQSRYWLGKKQPIEMIEKRVAKTKGDKNGRWKDGRQIRDYRKVVEKIQCFNCDSKSNLGIHHIDYDHYNNSPGNLQVLCVSCHMSLHKKAYWDSVNSGKEPRKSNAPTGWNRD